MSILGREAETSKFNFGGCPGASGKLASKGMFRALLGSSWPRGPKFTPDDNFFVFWIEAKLEAVNSEHPGWRPSWRL